MSDSIGGIVVLAVFVLLVVSYWKMFVKAGRSGWNAIIPIYNVYAYIKISGKSGWWLIPALIPGESVIVMILVKVNLAEKFGKGVGFGLGLTFLPFIFLPILAFSDAQYQQQGAGMPTGVSSVPNDNSSM